MKTIARPNGKSAPAGDFRLTVSAETGSKFVPFIEENLLAAHRLIRPALHELSVALVGEKRMSELHGKYMQERGPTDVLTFELAHNRKHRVTSGEVIVCVGVAKRQSNARSGGNSLANELLLYALHGMLHLCGWDDRTQADFRDMHRKEDEILVRLGVGPVFHRPPRGRRTGSGAS